MVVYVIGQPEETIADFFTREVVYTNGRLRVMKVGDKVKLIDRFWDCAIFRHKPRAVRKSIAAEKDNVLTIAAIVERLNQPYAMFENKEWMLPVALLEPITTDKTTETLKRGTHPEFVPGNEFVVIFECYGLQGETVTLLHNDGTFMPRFHTSQGRLFLEWAWLAPANHKPTTRQWTDAELREAREIIGEIVTNMQPNQHSYMRDYKGLVEIRYTSSLNDTYHTFYGKPSDKDEYNKYVGHMVALCKATRRPLPEWVTR